MHMRLISPFSTEIPSSVNALLMGKSGQVTLESASALAPLPLACGQKAQFALHLPAMYVRKYAVVGFAFRLPLSNLNVMAEPEDTLILSILRPYPGELSQDL